MNSFIRPASAGLYLVTDCSNPMGSCVVWSGDDPDSLDDTNDTGEGLDIYLIVDGFRIEKASGDYTRTGNNGGTVTADNLEA